MKIGILLVAAFFSTASFANISMKCVEFTPEASEYETSLEKAVSMLENGESERVKFKVLEGKKIKSCPQLIQEIENGEGTEILGLDIGKSNKNCIFDNAGNSSIVYGWVCKRN